MVSVCLATYNGERFITQQLSSILAQLNNEDEVIVSDDNSTDATLQKIYDIADTRIKVFQNKLHPGVIGNFENALKQATKEIIFLADQDDIWKDDKVNTFKIALRDADLVVSDCNFIDENGREIAESYFKIFKSGAGLSKNFIKNSYLGNCMAFNSSVKSLILPFPRELFLASNYHVYHDVWIGLLSNMLVEIKFIPAKLSSYRRHSNNASPTEANIKSPNNIMQKFSGRAWLFLALAKRFLKIKILS